MSTSVALSDVRMDGGTQSRAALTEDTIAEYAETYRANLKGGRRVEMPSITVFREGKTLWLADGFHRVLAAQRAGQKRIEAEVRQGTQRDAILFSCGANATHGLKRTNADKRRAVETLLRDAEWGARSDNWIAEQAAVSRTLIVEVRAELQPVEKQVAPRQGHDGKTRKLPATTPALVSAGAQNGESSAGGGDDGEEGAGGMAASRPEVTATPAPDEPPVEMLGLIASAEWLQKTRGTRDLVDRIDHDLRQLMVAARSLPQPTQQRVWGALHDAAAVARAERPAVVCPICRDPDGSGGRRKGCLGCAGNGWLSEDGRKGCHPSVLTAGTDEDTQ